MEADINHTQVMAQTKFEDIELTRLAFGSCYEPRIENILLAHDQSSIWEGITDFSPQVFLLLGDNFYTDISMEEGFPHEIYMPANTNFLEGEPLSRFPNTKDFDLRLFQEGYNRVLAQESFQDFLKNVPAVRIGALWDDHDFCANDCFGAGDFSLSGRITEEAKIESRQQFFSFLEQSNPDESYLKYKESQEQWADPKQGIYASYLFGKEKRKVRVILLDTRFHQDPEEGSLLGAAQWKWLENILNQDDDAVFTIIASSIQYFPDLQRDPIRRKIGTKFGESWGEAVKTNFILENDRLEKQLFTVDFQTERKRLMSLVAKSKRNGVVFLSGDKHIGAIHYLTPKEQATLLSKDDPISLGYPIYDITSSGLSHAFANVHRGAHVGVANWLYQSFLTTQRHFGTIEFDWSNQTNPSMTISFRTEKNKIALTKDWKDNLSARNYSISDLVVLYSVGARYIFKPVEPLSIQLSLQDLTRN